MTLCVALLIAAEFMPVSLLTPMATDLHATQGQAGQAISVSGFLAVATSLVVATVASRFNLRHVLVVLAATMLLSLVLVAEAHSFPLLMVARALLGITIGGFWSLATATLMRLVAASQVSRALGLMYMGNAAATAFAAPIGSYLGGWIGWRGVFWALVPLAVINVAWLWISLPSLPPRRAIPASRVVGLLRQPHVRRAVLACMLGFAGAFAAFTYLRPFLETRSHASVGTLSLLLLALGAAGFVGTSAATVLLQRHLFRLLWSVPLALGLVTLMLIWAAPQWMLVAGMLALWGALNAAAPVAWFNWLAREVPDEPEAGGSLMVGAIQLAIMAGAGLGGALLDHLSIDATFVGGAVLLLLGAMLAASPARMQSGR